MNYRTPDIYQHYIECGGDLSFKNFREIICEFNMEVMDQILHGREFNMKKGLSRLSIMRVDRCFKRPRINWNESNQYKQELLNAGKELFSKNNPNGHKWFVYYIDDWHLRFYWEKRHCQIKNRTAYRFNATRGPKGHTTRLKEILANDSFAYLDFRTREKS